MEETFQLITISISSHNTATECPQKRLTVRPGSHRSIRYTVFAVHYTISSPPQTTFKWCTVEGAESRLWWRSKHLGRFHQCLMFWTDIRVIIRTFEIFENMTRNKSVLNISEHVAHLRYVHSLRQSSCDTDVSITYLPQLNATRCTSTSLPCSSAMQLSAQRRKYDHGRNADAVDYDRIFRTSVFKLLGHQCYK